MEAAFQIQTFFDDRNQHINRNGNPNLGSDRIFRCSIEGFDPQMLLDPSKEQFHLPTTSIELSDRESRQEKIVGEKHQTLLACHIEVAHSTKPFGIAAFGDRIVECDDLIALQAGLLSTLWEYKRRQSNRFLARVIKKAPD